MFFTTSDGARLHVEQAGDGVPMVLAHGGPGLWDYLAEMAEVLEPRAQVVRYDQRGGGRSERRGPYTIERFVADYDEVRAAARLDRVVAAGHSWGATLALLYATRHPERVRGVLYVAGVGCEWARFRPAHKAEMLRRMGPAAPRFTQLGALPERSADEEAECNRLRWTVDYVDADAARPRVQRMLEAGFPVNVECNRMLDAEASALTVADWRDRLRGLDVPVLVVAGARDPRPVAAIDSLVGLLPKVERHVLPDSGHFPWVEQRERFASAVFDWLARV